MLHVELVPDLSHCIETAAREEYEDMLKQLLGTGEANKELQKRLEILKLSVFPGKNRDSRQQPLEMHASESQHPRLHN